MKTTPGTYVRRRDDGLEEVAPSAPDVVMCRRVVDFPNATPPAGAAVGPCNCCGQLVAFDPRGPHPDTPRRCLQCTGVQPLPFDQQN